MFEEMICDLKHFQPQLLHFLLHSKAKKLVTETQDKTLLFKLFFSLKPMDQIWKLTMKTNFNLNILYSYLQTNKKGLVIKSTRDIQYAKKSQTIYLNS